MTYGKQSTSDLRRSPYPEDIPDQQAGSERFTRRLRDARDSLPSYGASLCGGTERITLDRLRQPAASAALGLGAIPTTLAAPVSSRSRTSPASAEPYSPPSQPSYHLAAPGMVREIAQLLVQCR